MGHLDQDGEKDELLSFLVRDGLYRNPCVSVILCVICVCVCVLRFQNSQRNLHQGQPGACYWSAALYKQPVRCATSVQCAEAGLNSCATVLSKVPALQCHKMWQTVPDSCSICRACFYQNLTYVSMKGYEGLRRAMEGCEGLWRGMMIYKSL